MSFFLSFACTFFDVEAAGRDVFFLNDEIRDKDGLVGLENLGEECWGGFAEEADDADEMLEVLLNKEEANEVEEAREVNEVEEVEERIEEDMVWSW